jgi:two-component system chemotaxis sensor kinase CheA
MKARMLPVANVFHKFPRLVRDLTSQSGKQVNFTMSGQETELDRSVIEQLSDPLVHLLRNSLDHGIESPEQRVASGKFPIGSVALSATPAENHILIEVRDDGAGIDGRKVVAKAIEKGLISAEAAERLSEQEAVELIFLPGLSTARTLTDISGRGVGMDIVKSTVDRMGGHIAIQSAVGKGSTFSITLPLTLAIMQALLVSVDEAIYALPLNMVTEILSVPNEQIQMLQGTEATLVRGSILPLTRLRQYFDCSNSDATRGAQHVVATRIDGQVLGLVVDHVIGEQEIVMKPLGNYMGYIRGLSGATILGDGRIGLLIDVPALKNWAPQELAA